MFNIFRNDKKKMYFVCKNQADADFQGGTWTLVNKNFSSFDLAFFTARKLAEINTGFSVCGGYVAAAPLEE